jgi:hypothetical protein
LFYAGGFLWVCLFEEYEAFAQAVGVFVGYREDADAALVAPGFADQVGARALGGGG